MINLSSNYALGNYPNLNLQQNIVNQLESLRPVAIGGIANYLDSLYFNFYCYNTIALPKNPNAITSISVTFSGADGKLFLGDLPNLTSLVCYFNAISEIHCSYMDKLIAIYANNNLLKNISLEKCSKLEELNLNNNLLSDLKLNGCSLIHSLNISANSLSVNTVNHILSVLDANGVHNGTCNISGGTNAAPTNLTSVNNLVSKGWTVIHN